MLTKADREQNLPSGAENADGGEIFYQDDRLSVSRSGVQIEDHFYPIRDIQKISVEKERNRPFWVQFFISAAFLMLALAMGANYWGKGPVGFLMIFGLSITPLLLGGGAVFGLLYPSYGLYFESFFDKDRVFQTKSPKQVLQLKKAISKAQFLYREQEVFSLNSGKIPSFF